MIERPLIVTAFVLLLATRTLMAHVGSAITFDRSGRLYFCDTARDIVWRVEHDGTLTLIARGVHTNVLWIRDDGSLRYPDGGYVSDTAFVAGGPHGAAYRTDGHRLLRRSAGGLVEPFAGDTASGFADGPRDVARFRRPVALAVDSVGNVYVADYGNRRVRKVSPAGHVSTVARVGGWFRPSGLAIRNDLVYVLERVGDYWGITGVLAGAPFVADLVGHPRVRALRPDGSTRVIVGLASTSTRIATALFGVGALAFALLVRRRAIKRRPPRA